MFAPFFYFMRYICAGSKKWSAIWPRKTTHHCHTIMRVSINVVLAWIIILVCRGGERLLGFSESWFFTRKSRSSILLVPSWNLHYVVLKTNWEIFFFAFLSHFKILSIYASKNDQIILKKRKCVFNLWIISKIKLLL